jgi:hypothetical protein
MKFFNPFWILAAFLLNCSAALADDVITNVMSPIASYQYPDDFSSEALTNGGVMSPILSYQYYEWPGNDVLQLDSSPWVSYFYPLGDGGSGVSGGFSQVEILPSSLPADGQTPATVTVTLLDGNGNPVSGKVVRVTVVEQTSGGVMMLSSVSQSASPTDGNGQATATLRSAVAGTALVSVQDITDGITLARHATVHFGSALVAPGQNLANAILELANSSSNLLVRSCASIATDEGSIGDYFHNQVTADQAEAAATALSGSIGSLLALVPGGEDALKAAAHALDQDVVLDRLDDILGIIAGSRSGLSEVGQVITNRNSAYEGTILQYEQNLLSGVPPGSTIFTEAYTNDLALRAQGNSYLKEILLSQDLFLTDMQQKAMVGQVDLLKPVFITLDVAGAVAGTAFATPAGGYALAEAINTGELWLTAPLNQQQLDSDQQSYMTAISSLNGCAYYSTLIYANTASAFSEIAQGQEPNPITGKMLAVTSQVDVQRLEGVTGNIGTWLAQQFLNTTPVFIAGEYSFVALTNTSPQRAFFSVTALYSRTVSIDLDNFGTTHYSMTVPMMVSSTTNLNPNQVAQVTVYYGSGKIGALPDPSSAIVVNVLGYDNHDGIYGVGSASTSIQWPTSIPITSQFGTSSRGIKPLGGPSTTNVFVVENPIRCFVFQTPAEQSYQAQIWVANPFAIPLLATVTQPLPTGVVVVSTDGLLESGSIVWTNMIVTNGLLEQSFSFTLSVPPGAQTNLPPATVMFSDGTGTNSLTQTASAASFVGLFPVGVSSVVSAGTWGADTAAELTVTNFTAARQAGSLAISLVDDNGNAVTNFSLSFSVNALSGTNLSYTLPGTLAPGTYAVSGVLSMGGGSSQVFSGTYDESPAPVWLGWGPAAGALTNGFVLQVNATAGYGYLIQASTNLVDWEPIQYLVLTNSSVYFTDYYAPGYSQRFYRATPVSQVESQVQSLEPPQLGSVTLVSGGGVQIALTGGIGQAYTVQASTNLVDWVAVTNILLSSGSGQFIEYSVTNYPQRFYRAVIP